MGTLHVVSLSATIDYPIAGVPDATPIHLTPVQIGAKSDWEQVVNVGRYAMAGRDAAKNVFAWGYTSILGMDGDVPEPVDTGYDFEKLFPVVPYRDDQVVYLLDASGNLKLAGNTDGWEYGVANGTYYGAPTLVSSGFATLEDIQASSYAGVLFRFADGSYKARIIGGYGSTFFCPSNTASIQTVTPSIAAVEIAATFSDGIGRLADGSLYRSNGGTYVEFTDPPASPVAKIFPGAGFTFPVILDNGALYYANSNFDSFLFVDAGPFSTVGCAQWPGYVVAVKTSGDVVAFDDTATSLIEIPGANATSAVMVGDLIFYISSGPPAPPPAFWQDLIGTVENQ